MTFLSNSNSRWGGQGTRPGTLENYLVNVDFPHQVSFIRIEIMVLYIPSVYPMLDAQLVHVKLMNKWKRKDKYTNFLKLVWFFLSEKAYICTH
jgi:hypothetical protein